MKKIRIIFLKELKDTLRDRRTLFAMILVPLLLYPFLITVLTKVAQSQTEESLNKQLRIVLIDNGQAQKLSGLFRNTEKFTMNPPDLYDSLEQLYYGKDTVAFAEAARQLIHEGDLDAILIFRPGFDAAIDSRQAGKMDLYYKSTSDQDITRTRLMAIVEMYKQQELENRYREAGLTREFIQVVDVVDHDVASQKEKLGEMLGGLLPYFFIAFCLMGAMYPAIDLGAGEKERGTLETILTAPASRLEILLGKLGVILLGGLGSAMISLLGIYISIKSVSFIPPDIMNTIETMLEPQSILLIFLLLLPLAIFFAAGLFSISSYAKSFKEAQSMIQPLMFIVFLPAIIGLLPGIHLNTVTALIPILNVTLATKQVISGTTDPVLFIETMVSLVLLAGPMLWLAIWWYGREKNILRG